MVKRRKKKSKNRKPKTVITQQDIDSGIRKPTAPPTKQFGTRRPPSKVHPARNPVDD